MTWKRLNELRTDYGNRRPSWGSRLSRSKQLRLSLQSFIGSRAAFTQRPINRFVDTAASHAIYLEPSLKQEIRTEALFVS